MTKEFLDEIRNWKTNYGITFGEFLFYLLRKEEFDSWEKGYEVSNSIEDVLYCMLDDKFVELIEKELKGEMND